MDTQKFLVGGIIGGILFFFLGWLVWGIVLKDAMAMPADIAEVIDRGDNMIMWAMALSCLIWGLFISFIYSHWAGISTFSGGVKAGAIIAAFTSLSMGLGSYSMYTFGSLGNMGLDLVANILVTGITGGVIGWWLGRGND